MYSVFAVALIVCVGLGFGPFCGVILNLLSSLASSCRGRKSLMLYFNCELAICVLCLFLAVP